MKESKAMMKKEVSFMKKKGAPKSMIRHEEAEYGMKKGVKKMRMGGMSRPEDRMLSRTLDRMGRNSSPLEPPSLEPELPPSPPPPRVLPEREYRKGGSVGSSYRRAADGIASKGKTKGHVVKMAGGGMASSYRRAADGIASKGKTKGKMVKMMGGGYCG